MEKYVGLGKGETVCMSGISGGERRGGMGIGDDKEAGSDSGGGHDWVSNLISGKGEEYACSVMHRDRRCNGGAYREG